MLVKLSDYKKIVSPQIIGQIKTKIKKLKGKHLLFISSTHQGGGVAEILNSLIPLFNEAGLDVGWRIVHGKEDFFETTKTIHNSLQGGKKTLTKNQQKIYYETNKRFAKFTHINSDHDLVVVHDPQPLPLINFYKKNQPWLFRLHLDISSPNQKTFKYLTPFIKKYDHLIVSHQNYLKKGLNMPYSIIYPAIDPLNQKNQPLPQKTVNKYLNMFGIKQKLPIISQVSRYDKWKDPSGVIDVFNKVRAKKRCQLVLLGQTASDDPEDQKIYELTEKKAKQSPYKKDIKVLLINDNINPTLANCLQQNSAVVIQKSLKEGFGLTVTEALFKKTPVVASNVGGIPLQVIDGQNGYLNKPNDIKGFAESVLKILDNKKIAQSFGENGRQHIIDNFLITRLMLDWLNLFEKYV